MFRNQHKLGVIVVVLGLLFLTFSSVRAQESFSIFFDPDPAYIFTDNGLSTTVSLKIANAPGVNAFDITLSYNENVALLSSYAIGAAFLPKFCTVQTNVPGTLTLSCTKTGLPYVFGEAEVLSLVFTAPTVVASTPLTLSLARFVNQVGSFVFPEIDHGLLNVQESPSPPSLPLEANIDLQGKADRLGVTLNLLDGENYSLDFSAVSKDIEGINITLSSVVIDTYTVTVSHERCLDVTSALGKTKTAPESGTITITPLVLRAGNSVSDDNINDDDIKAITDAYGNPSINPNADVNFDGLVDMRDLALAAGNYGLTSSSAYVDWQP